MAVPAVAYYRMSTDRQEASIPDQRTQVETYAAKHGYSILREYRDEGISGDATEKRAGFQRMLRDAKEKGDFKVVLCWDQDRFGRFDPLEAGYWVKPLRDAGVRLETVAQGRIDWEDFAGRIIYAVQQEGKHAFLRDLSRNTLRGKLRSAQQGGWAGGRPPFGYTLKNKRLVPDDPEKVRFVRWLFQTYATPGMSLRKLVDAANAQGVPSARGGQWRINSIGKILRCPLYTGDMVWNRLRNGKYHSIVGGELTKAKGARKLGVRATDRQDRIVVPNAHEPLIDRATWEAVQKKLERNKTCTTPHQDTVFLLTGLIHCGNCGSRMHGSTDRRPNKYRNGPYNLYTCSGYAGYGLARCERFRLPEHVLVPCIVRKIREDFLNKDNLAKLEKEIARRLEARHAADPSQTARLRDQIARLDQQISQGAERVLVAPAELVEMLTAKLRSWQDERNRLQGELNSLEGRSPVQVGLPSVEQVMAQLWTLDEQLDQVCPTRLREAIRQMVSRIDCWFEHRPRGLRTVRTLARGLIHLRQDLHIVRVVPNVLMIGSPGTGKTMLARRLPTILPPLTPAESLETTRIYSALGRLSPDEALLATRPFRSPHHTISDAGMVGGGSTPAPGEISLAHHGILFLDELPEFNRRSLEVLRQPLEEGKVTISRALHSTTFPASFVLVASMNPCQCGYLGDSKHVCKCTPMQIERYMGRISGPLLDRIDLHVEVPSVPFQELAATADGTSSAAMREQVQRARKAQRERFGADSHRLNSRMTSRQLRKHCALDEEGKNLLKSAMEDLGLSARAHDRILRMARTIADLDGSAAIQPGHVVEAINYRSLDRKLWAR